MRLIVINKKLKNILNMSGLKFDKRELGNLEYSLDREMLATDRRGGYMSTTIVSPGACSNSCPSNQ